ncbi:MAG: hypothetical protein RR630_01280 [Coprobacillus sp.]
MKQTSFMIVVKNTQNETWQGSIRWVEEKRETHFRSALELMKLIDSAIDTEIVENKDSTRINFERD